MSPTACDLVLSYLVCYANRCDCGVSHLSLCFQSRSGLVTAWGLA